jgi:omega-6 fatty acid desaturase (delta-12 desaturase)
MISRLANGVDGATLRRVTQSYQDAALRICCWQLASSFLPFLAICALMYWSLSRSFFLTVLLAFLAAGFVVRIFIIQHDCGHGSFFRSRRANQIAGWMCSLVTLTPYAMWRRQHAGHHRVWNNLDRRQSGADIYSSCTTVGEYRGMSGWRKLGFRVTRHPLIALVLLPPLVFLLLYRISFDTPRDWRRERRSVHLTNLALAFLFGSLGWLLGYRQVLLVQLPVSAIAGIYGVWLFSLQHRFETVWWAGQERWDDVKAAMFGSSYLKLPRILQWFTGNIGFHHIHHLNAHVPNYHLPACAAAVAGLQPVPVLGLADGLRAFRFILWDEERRRMVRLAELTAL